MKMSIRFLGQDGDVEVDQNFSGVTAGGGDHSGKFRVGIIHSVSIINEGELFFIAERFQEEEPVPEPALPMKEEINVNF